MGNTFFIIIHLETTSIRRTADDVIDKTKPWQLAEIIDPGDCGLLTLPESTDTSSKVL